MHTCHRCVGLLSTLSPAHRRSSHPCRLTFIFLVFLHPPFLVFLFPHHQIVIPPSSSQDLTLAASNTTGVEHLNAHTNAPPHTGCSPTRLALPKHSAVGDTCSRRSARGQHLQCYNAAQLVAGRIYLSVLSSFPFSSLLSVVPVLLVYRGREG
jgi:hypothetical protein